MLIPFGVFSAAGAGGDTGGSYELISTSILGSDTTDITFSSIPSTYRHLQLRMVGRYSTNVGKTAAIFRFNSDSGTNYYNHFLSGNGTAVSSGGNPATSIRSQDTMVGNSSSTNSFGASILDVLDYASTTKYKTARILGGVASNSDAEKGITLASGVWMNTSAISSLTIVSGYLAGSRFSLYGIKG